MSKIKSRRKSASFLSYFKMFKGAKMPWLFIALATVAQILMYMATIKISTLTGDVVDAAGNIDTERIVTYVVTLVIIAIAMVFEFYMNGLAGQKINMALREKLWKKIMHIPLKNYDADCGEALVSRVTTDCDYASAFFTTVIGLFSTIVGLVMYTRNMYLTSPTMTYYMLILLPVSVFLSWLFGKIQYIIGKKTQGTLSDTTAYLIERTQNMRLIKSSVTEITEAEKGEEKFRQQYKVDIKRGYANILYLFIEKAVYFLGLLIPFIVGGILVYEGVLKVGQVIAFYMFTGNVTTAFTGFIQAFGTIKQSVSSLERVIDTVNIPSEDVQSGRRITEPDADITIDNITFGYGENPVLNEFSCVIPKNKTTAVIGANGSGKTTLFKLLERFYEPEKGYILFGKTPINEFNLHSWRKAFAMVAQDRLLMEGTIRENITYGCERDISDAEIEKALALSCCDRFVNNLPDGVDSYVAPGGQNFSGGQRQCLAIARAIMHNPDYLLLDEATSNLDAKSERMVTDALNNLMKNRTTIIIAHNLSAIRHADNVIVIKNGRVADSGSPEEIIKTSNDYREFVMKQGKRAEC